MVRQRFVRTLLIIVATYTIPASSCSWNLCRVVLRDRFLVGKTFGIDSFKSNLHFVESLEEIPA